MFYPEGHTQRDKERERETDTESEKEIVGKIKTATYHKRVAKLVAEQRAKAVCTCLLGRA
jgi:hypothetical protein